MITHTEISFLRACGTLVWIGLFILIVSGTGIFFLDMEKYLNSNKFLAKMTIVTILMINGVIFHIVHIPRLLRHAGQHFPSSDEFMHKRPLLLISGAVSVVSWSWALVLGMMKYVPYAYGTIMLVYIGVLGAAIIAALLLKNKLLPSK